METAKEQGQVSSLCLRPFSQLTGLLTHQLGKNFKLSLKESVTAALCGAHI